MIYRNRATIYWPQPDGSFQAQTFPSINRAKAEVREKKLTVRRGKPPAKTALQGLAGGSHAPVGRRSGLTGT